MAVGDAYASLLGRINQSKLSCGCEADPVALLAVSKGQSAERIREVNMLGQRSFGENYLQEALTKINALQDLQLEWHFIGALQSNKLKDIATHFDWVQSVASVAHAKKLNAARPTSLAPLNVCLQVNLDAEPQKSGLALEEVPDVARAINAFSQLKLRGLMAIPQAKPTEEASYQTFQRLTACFDQLQAEGLPVDTLSMGMSADFDAAIRAGSTLLRIGTALFGSRLDKKQGEKNAAD